MKKTKSNKATSLEQQNDHTPSSKLLKLLDPEASWDKDNLGDTLHWIRQGLGILSGLLCGAVPLIGAFWIVGQNFSFCADRHAGRSQYLDTLTDKSSFLHVFNHSTHLLPFDRPGDELNAHMPCDTIAQRRADIDFIVCASFSKP
ncbi:hypothetical protein ZIOFF_031794 [Zingiber officinale]|uniref:Uncharacterized protein n=1 Tax=Zingiber officinale TaxID=94328 RepID=A0A8J5GFL2_ZINOF|nr:hypothetical protein ZIOFF_031794 [Zingiber officinale]